MSADLRMYGEVVGFDVLEELQVLADHARGRVLQTVSSSFSGPNITELLSRILPFLEALGVSSRWDVMPGDQEFRRVTTAFHDALLGRPKVVAQGTIDLFEAKTEEARRALDISGDIVFVHDLEPVGLVKGRGRERGWIWRCHLDLSSPDAHVWSFLKPYVEMYDCAVFSMPDFAQRLAIPQYMIAPSIDPLSDKNKHLDSTYVAKVLESYGIDRQRPLLTQISRFDRLKDPLGVIAAYRMVRKRFNVQLLLAGGSDGGDPEVEQVLNEVREHAANDPDIHIIALPPSSDLAINALVRGSTVVLQKAIREGFGMTVSEALWKRKPVIGSAVGGIKAQIVDGVTGFLVHSAEGAANRVVQLLADRNLCNMMGANGHNLVKQNFLITRHAKDYLLLMLANDHPGEDIVYLWPPVTGKEGAA